MNIKLKKRKGLTLVEIILSVAIMGVVAVSFLSILSGSLKMVKNSGNSSKALYGAQSGLNEKLTQVQAPSATLSVRINGTQATISGNYVDQTVTVGSQTVTIKVFVPQ